MIMLLKNSQQVKGKFIGNPKLYSSIQKVWVVTFLGRESLENGSFVLTGVGDLQTI